MDFTLTEENEMIRATARQFAEEELAPLAVKMDREEKYDPRVTRLLGDHGYMGMEIAEEHGGSNLGAVNLAIALEEVNRVCASSGVTMSVQNGLVNGPINKFGTPEQKAKYLPRLTNAEWMGAYCLSEPVSGSDAAAMVSFGEDHGDHFVLNGTKRFITSGLHADLYVLFSRTDRSAKPSRGITAFIVERAFPGVKVGKKEKKTGLRGSDTVDIILDGARVPRENVLGEVNNGFKIAMDTLDAGRVGIAAQAVGIAQAALDAAVKYAQARQQFGEPIANFQMIQWKIADMATRVEAARLLTYRAACLKEKRLPHGKEASMAKLFASETANFCADEAVQVHGGYGYVGEFPVERYFRDARITEIYEGTSEIQRLVISRAVLK
ncbi:MAG: acyl-CoA dehydrogenase family protein [Planctomycetes bacterium]|nr:acyl-CoA dehydrogenase family protein [Planctomycetota bacterium]